MLKDSYLACKSALEKGGIENAAFEAQCMLEHLTGFGRASLLAHGGDAFDRQDELDEMIKRRLKKAAQKRAAAIYSRQLELLRH